MLSVVGFYNLFLLKHFLTTNNRAVCSWAIDLVWFHDVDLSRISQTLHWIKCRFLDFIV